MNDCVNYKTVESNDVDPHCSICANYKPVESEPKFKVGDFVVDNYDNHLSLRTSDNSWIDCVDGKIFYSIDSLTTITIGSKFKTKCDDSIFSECVGEFVVMGSKRTMNVHEKLLICNGYVCDVTCKEYKPEPMSYIALPSIDSRWWDRQIGDNIIARRYETKVVNYQQYVFNIKCDDGTWRKYEHGSNGGYIVITALGKHLNPPIIPYLLSNGKFDSPKAR